eukprot:TRINITY_DN4310_c0_g1_i8.p1 TRINITY_DN4310_c0_g1~~TRINITY_DN4310_c0_g1_i8.p1  ORF type:complete len:130 (-),score=17.93 TRINITY_DN4310_c0_g1_i8:81-470(-)
MTKLHDGLLLLIEYILLSQIRISSKNEIGSTVVISDKKALEALEIDYIEVNATLTKYELSILSYSNWGLRQLVVDLFYISHMLNKTLDTRAEKKMESVVAKLIKTYTLTKKLENSVPSMYPSYEGLYKD